MLREGEHPQVAVFIDAENILIGALSGGFPRPIAALMDRVREQGFLMSAQAYGDWTRQPCLQFLREFQMNTIEMKQLPTSASGKNTADINLAVDAIEMALSPAAPHTIVLAAADRDFVPLVQKLRRYGKEVIGIGVRGRVSRELEQVCSTFVMLDDIIPEAAPEAVPPPRATRGAPEDSPDAGRGAEGTSPGEPLDQAAAFRLLATVTEEIIRAGRDALATRVVDRLRKASPSFDLRKQGFGSFGDFALAAEAQKAVRVTRSKSGDLRLSPYVEDPGEAELRFDTPAEACESYRSILLSGKKAPIIRWADRRRLLEHLWAALAPESEGLTLGEMSSLLTKFGRQQGLGLPDRAIQKLVNTLNVAECFTDGGQARRFRDPSQSQTRLRAGTPLDEAEAAMHESYVRGIQAVRPQAPLDEHGLALLLFDEDTRRHLTEVRALLKRIAPPPAAGKKTAKRAPRKARGRAKPVAAPVVDTPSAVAGTAAELPPDD
jgi:hypothetical protein